MKIIDKIKKIELRQIEYNFYEVIKNNKTLLITNNYKEALDFFNKLKEKEEEN